MLRRLAVSLVFVSWLLGAAQVQAQAAPNCQYILGFQALHALDPADIGGCLDNQTFAGTGTLSNTPVTG